MRLRLRVTIFLIVVCLYTENVIGGSVFIYNNLEDGHLAKMHCKSGNNNLGYHVRSSSKNYNFSFTDHFMGKTHYWCHLYKGRHFKDHVVIVAYDGQSFSKLNNWVRWSLREDGIYRSVDGENPFRFRYTWDGHF